MNNDRDLTLSTVNRNGGGGMQEQSIRLIILWLNLQEGKMRRVLCSDMATQVGKIHSLITDPLLTKRNFLRAYYLPKIYSGGSRGGVRLIF